MDKKPTGPQKPRQEAPAPPPPLEISDREFSSMTLPQILGMTTAPGATRR